MPPVARDDIGARGIAAGRLWWADDEAGECCAGSAPLVEIATGCRGVGVNMWRWCVLYLCIWGLVGCATTTFVPRPLAASMQIAWVVADDVQTLCRQRLGGSTDDYLLGCATWSRAHDSCTVYTARRTTQEVLGHEVRHCFEGRFHH